MSANELVAVTQGASNRLINVEDFSEADVQTLHAHYAKLVELAKPDGQLTESHSVEEAHGRHHSKRRRSLSTETGHELAKGAKPGSGPRRPTDPVAADGGDFRAR